MALQLRTRLPVAEPVRMAGPADDALSWLEVDLGRVEHNARALRGVLDAGRAAGDGGQRGRKRVAMCPVLKKDAYGLGAAPIAHRLARAGEAAMFAVYSPDEAADLVANAVTTPILLLMPMRALTRTDALYRHAVAEKLHLSIHDPRQLGEVNDLGQRLGIRFPCHLYLDTGMARSGLSHDQALDAARSTTAHRYVRLAGVYTHFAAAGDDPAFTGQQRAAFDAFLEEAGDALPNDILRHAASSAALLRDPEQHLDMARPGIALLGYASTSIAELRPVMRWCSRIIHAQPYKQGTPVSYGSTHTLQRDSVLGIVPVGHGDGYPVALSNKAVVRVNDTPCRVLGQVSMDQIVIDLTPAPGDGKPQEPASLVGQTVEVYSNDPHAPNALPKLAELADTRVYELLCRLSPNLPRRVVQG